MASWFKTDKGDSDYVLPRLTKHGAVIVMPEVDSTPRWQESALRDSYMMMPHQRM